jgi:hypothetical protein
MNTFWTLITGILIAIAGIIFKSWWSKPKEFEEGKKRMRKLLNFGNLAGLIALFGLSYLVYDDINVKHLILFQKSQYEREIVDTVKYFEMKNEILKESSSSKPNKKTSSFSIHGSGNISSQNQSGGITGPVTVNVNEAIAPEWIISPSEKVDSNQWRSKMNINGRGKLPYYKWNILITFNTKILRIDRNDKEMTDGSWTNYDNPKDLQHNQIFVGFPELEPWAVWSAYIYSKDSLIVKDVKLLTNQLQ